MNKLPGISPGSFIMFYSVMDLRNYSGKSLNNRFHHTDNIRIERKLKVWRMRHLLHLSFMFFVFSGRVLFPGTQQNDSHSKERLEQKLYENALLQVEVLFTQVSAVDSLVFLLMDDAKQFADQYKYGEAYELLNTIIDLLQLKDFGGLENKVQAPTSGNLEAQDSNAITMSHHVLENRWEVQLEVGVDYSQQEFEMSFVESDSTLVEELQNPYISFFIYQPLRLGSKPANFTHRFRLDNQFINYSILGTFETQSNRFLNRFEFEGDYFAVQSAQESDFLEGQGRYLWGNPYDFINRWYLDFRTRYKWYPSPDSINSNIFNISANLFFERFLSQYQSIYFNLIPEYYLESRQLGQEYFQSRLVLFYRHRKNFNRFFEPGLEIVYRDFQNNFNGETYQNRYWSLLPQVETEWAFSPQWGVRLKLFVEKRKFRTVNEVNPDFLHFSVETIQKFYWGDYKSIGIGYSWETRKHNAPLTDVDRFVSQEDFISQGVIFCVEWISLSGLLLNLDYRLNWRDYPHSQVSPFSPYYSNRLIHSISIIGWIPLTNHWQIQLFSIYDNDRDLDLEHNDNRSTIMNLSLIYKF